MSPVIGVILMVAITVILATVIGTFVLGIGENIDTNPSAGVTVNESNHVTLTSLGPSTEGIYCNTDPATSTITATNQVGASINCDGANSVVAYSGSGVPTDQDGSEITNKAVIRVFE